VRAFHVINSTDRAPDPSVNTSILSTRSLGSLHDQESRMPKRAV